MKYEQLENKVQSVNKLFNELKELNETEQDKINHLEESIIQTRNHVTKTETILQDAKPLATKLHFINTCKNITLIGITGLAIDCIFPFGSVISYGISFVGKLSYDILNDI